MLRLLKVTGDSLTPEYREGDYVFIAKIPFFFDSIKKGDVVAFRHSVHGTMIKYVDRVDAGQEAVYVSGTHADSVDSRQFGPVRKEEILGKVIWHIRKPGNN